MIGDAVRCLAGACRRSSELSDDLRAIMPQQRRFSISPRGAHEITRWCRPGGPHLLQSTDRTSRFELEREAAGCDVDPRRVSTSGPESSTAASASGRPPPTAAGRMITEDDEQTAAERERLTYVRFPADADGMLRSRRPTSAAIFPPLVARGFATVRWTFIKVDLPLPCVAGLPPRLRRSTKSRSRRMALVVGICRPARRSEQIAERCRRHAAGTITVVVGRGVSRAGGESSW